MNRSEQDQQQYGPDSRVRGRRDNASPDADTELGQQPGANECTHYPDQKIAHEAKASSMHDLTCKPTGDDADDEYEKKTFT